MTTSRGNERDSNAEEQKEAIIDGAANSSSSVIPESNLSRPYVALQTLTGLGYYGYSCIFGASKPAETPSPTSPLTLEKEKNIALYSISKLLEYRKYFSDYVERNGEKPPSESQGVNWMLSNCGGYIRINQEFAKRARDAINKAETEYTANNHHEAKYVCEALKELSQIHIDMSDRTGKVKDSIETIFKFFGLSTRNAEARNKNIDAVKEQLSVPTPRSRSLSSPRS
jgi:hypothetical protein